MKNIAFISCLFQLFCIIGLCQNIKKITYGNNRSAGKYFDIRGIKMYCEIYGSGKPLLMIHGNGGSIKNFENNIDYFSKKYQVIVADSRSQGKSRDKGDSISFEMMADDEAALLNILHIKTAFVIAFLSEKELQPFLYLILCWTFWGNTKRIPQPKRVLAKFSLFTEPTLGYFTDHPQVN